MNAILAFFVPLILYPILIKFFRKLGIGQFIREEGPDLHNYKQGIPTMGGILFLPIVLIFAKDLIPVLGLLFFACIGFFDDVLSIVRKSALGLTTRQKFLLQILASLILIFITLKNGRGTSIDIFGKTLDLGYLYPIFAVFVITGASNSVNLTDGLDGLAGWIFVSGSLPYMMFLLSRKMFHESIMLLLLSVLAFLIYNTKPASIFMGDTGSLALGGYLGALSVITKTEVFLITFFPIYVIEVLSVLIQVSYFKVTKKRVFKMAPIHHHFELLGWKEERIVFIFSILNLSISMIFLNLFGGIKNWFTPF
ncbi:MAG TPA: phospho-N-acetylmuramoyl-pentapeptide-transferase [Thermotoga sp.]|nr:phospho-N-acetylmuramoyl-pentapeptide-transferase [Thermotoga sp.]